jgi:endonuclease/exonuclease/phosphatase family metal-dependent hydrolase
LRVISYNLHAGRDAAGAPAFDRQVDLLRELAPDLLAIQEADRNWPRSGGVDHCRELGAALEMRGFFSPNLQGDWATGRVVHQFGIALLWKGVAEDVVGLGMPAVPGREHRGLARLEMEIGGRPVVFATTHFGRSAPERLAQARLVADWLLAIDRPVILAGDFNMTPGSPEHRVLAAGASDVTAGLGLVTYPGDVPDPQRDYVFTTGGLEVGAVQTAEGDASDHRPVVVEVLPAD